MPKFQDYFVKMRIAALLSLASCTMVWAQQQDSLATNWEQLQRNYLDQSVLKRQQAGVNAVLRHSDSTAEVSTVELLYATQRKTLFDPQQGKGLQHYGLAVHSFRRLDRWSSIWGAGRYGNQRSKAVRWNETSDLSWVYPYVLADSVGGDQKNEFYHFAGGYNREVGKQTFSVSGAYTAALLYRSVDPRTHNTSSDLTLSVGMSRPVGKYRLALHYDYRYYTQNNTVSIASPISAPAFFHLIGMGVDQKLFWGKNSETYYIGHMNGIGLQWQPIADKGLYGSLVAQRFYMDKSITNLRSLPVSEAHTRSVQGQLGYVGSSGKFTWIPQLSGGHYERSGRSYLFDNPTGSNYVKIGELQDFSHRVYQAAVGITVSYPLRSGWRWRVNPTLDMTMDKLSYNPQQRTMQWEKISYGFTTGLMRQRTMRSLWDVDLGLQRSDFLHADLTMPQALATAGLTTLIQEQFNYYSAAHTRYALRGSYYFPVSKRLIGKVGAEMAVVHFDQGQYNARGSLRLGIVL